MTGRSTVDPAALAGGASHWGIIALPETLRPVAGAADLVGLRGDAGLTVRAVDVLASGVRGLLVADPEPEDVTALTEASAESGVPVVLSSRWADAPAVAAAAPHLARLMHHRALLEARLITPTLGYPGARLLDLLRLLRRLAGPVDGATVIRSDDGGLRAMGSIGDARVSMSIVATRALPTSAAVRLTTPTEAVEVSLPDADTAAAGHAVVADAQGETLLPTRWESAHRAAWRRLARCASDGAATADLGAFAADASVVREALISGARPELVGLDGARKAGAPARVRGRH